MVAQGVPSGDAAGVLSVRMEIRTARMRLQFFGNWMMDGLPLFLNESTLFSI